MSFKAQHEVAAPRELVWEWHSRPGSLARLTPPFLPMVALKQAERLADGTTIIGLPAGLKWIARHDLSRYQRGYQFCEVCINSPMKALATWRHTHTFADAPTAGHTLITDTLDTRIPAAALHSLFAYRQQQLRHDLDFLSRMHSLNGAARPQRIAITGSRGNLGRTLTAQLQTAGHEVVQLVRTPAKAGQRTWNPLAPAPDLLEGINVVVHLAGEPFFGRFNDAHKAELRNSRLTPTRELAKLVAASPSVTALVSASAIGIYGPERGNEALTEASPTGDGFIADLCRDWEAATAPAAAAGKRVVLIRNGVSLSGNSGLLPLVRALFQTGLGGTFGDGDFWLSWIAHDDLTDIYFRAAVDTNLSGAINAVAPQPVRNRELTKALARELRRPAFIPIPTLGPTLLLGREGARELALANQHALPARLQALGHTFRYQQLGAALAHELGGEELLPPPS